MPAKVKIVGKLNSTKSLRTPKIPDIRQNRFGPFGLASSKIKQFKQKQRDNLGLGNKK